MNMIGADVAQLRDLAHYLTQAETQLTQLHGRIDARVGTPAWQGPDAQRFRSQWQSRHRSTIASAAAALAGMAKRVAQDAAEQEEASSAGGSAGRSAFHGPDGGTSANLLQLLNEARTAFPLVFGALGLASGLTTLGENASLIGRYPRFVPRGELFKYKSSLNGIFKVNGPLDKLSRVPIIKKLDFASVPVILGADVQDIADAKNGAARIDKSANLVEDALKSTPNPLAYLTA